MNRLLRSIKAQTITLLCIWMVAMLFSAEIILSWVMMLLAALALWEYQPGRGIRWRSTLGETWKRLRAEPALLAPVLFFIPVLASALWSSDLAFTLERLRIKAPFLVLPFVFAALPAFSKKELEWVLLFFVLVLTVACLYVGGNYILHYEVITEQISRGQPIPTPSNHIRFSLSLGLGVLAGGALFLSYKGRHRWLAGGLTLFLFLFLHVLSVRSGLAVLYLALAGMACWRAWQSGRIWLAVGALALVVGMPLIAYQTIPSFRTKIDYARWDWRQHLAGKGEQYSDSDRLVSLAVGLDIGNRHPVFGVGAGDLKQEVERVYATQYPAYQKPKMPHNQLLTVYAGTGIFGLLFFAVAFFLPLYHQKRYRNLLFLGFHLIMLGSFMMESTLENNYGISLYLLGLYLWRED